MDIKPGTSADHDERLVISENELTNKFLSGEMSFADYSHEWYGNDDEENEEDESSKSDPRQPIHLMKGQKRRRRTAINLSPALLGLMGEANLRFARGDKETAEKMCHEIIKLIPTAPEPYQTLAQIYENDTEKSLQFSLLAAHLSPSDATEWLRLANISNKRKDIKQEMTCYSQAIKAEPHNLALHIKRLDLLDKLEEINYPVTSLNVTRVRCYHKIVNSLDPTQYEAIMKYAKLAATIYHNSNELERALEVLTMAYKKCSSHFSLEDINIFLELLMARKQYQLCVEVFVANLGVEIEAEIQTVKNADGVIEEHTHYLNCTIPNDMPIDLKSKLLISFIHLGAHSLVQTLLDDFLANDVEKAGDLYMDIEEALSSVGQHNLAMQLLEPLVKNTTFDLGAVWLKHADCLYNLGKDEEAIESYLRVLKHAPQHSDARRKLFTIYDKHGMIDEALDILQQDYKFVVSAQLLYEQCSVLKKYNKIDKYVEVGEALLSKSFFKYRHPDELRIAFNSRTSPDLIYNFRTTRGENPFHEDDIHFDEDESFKLTPEEEWNFFTELLTIACNKKQYYVMQRLAFGAIMSKNIVTLYRPQIEFYCLQACLLANDYQNSFKIIRDYIMKYPTTRAWNILNLVMLYVEEIVLVKFLTRLFKSESYPVKELFLGNSFVISGRYLVALKYYLDYHNQFGDPLTAMLIGIVMIVMAAQRTVDRHHNLVLQGVCYLLKYQSLRKCDQETNYNMGRAYHMLSINNLAIEYYERALDSGPIVECPQHGVMDLTRETAFNLYLLYKDHSPHIARQFMLKYLVI
ncbi:general transcription factor 3C polypeptide 3 [Phthorimaea operculella]|nr:general transcription factor 3C polypeptide 3 [Phthorimaea operculella]